jgi:histidine ammonia-lyase
MIPWEILFVLSIPPHILSTTYPKIAHGDCFVHGDCLTVILNSRADLTLTAFYRVAWQRENVRIGPDAMQRIAACRASFLELIDKDPSVVIYGVTTAMGERASHRLTLEEREMHARIKPFPAATSFGDYLPDRVVRGIVFARLANFIEGHSATTPRITQAVAEMLDGGPMPQIAAAGQGGAGEILALYPLFAELSKGFDLEVKERGSLINGSPCAAALIADAAIAGRRRLQLALETFALSIEAFRAPLEHYDEALDSLWGDKDEAAALRSLRTYLGELHGRRNYQAPVSYRIVPRILGHAHRAVSAAERAARISLSSVSDNPVYLPPDAQYPYGRCLSTGGYHNAMAAPVLDDLAGIWADTCLLADRHCGKLLNGQVSHLPDQLLVGRQPAQSDGRGNIGYIPMAANGYVELAKAIAQRTFIPGSDSLGSGQDDVATPGFIAWSKEARAARCLDASLAMLAVVASQALFVTDRAAPLPLREFVELIRTHVAPVVEDRILGPELGQLADAITANIFAPDERIDSIDA